MDEEYIDIHNSYETLEVWSDYGTLKASDKRQHQTSCSQNEESPTAYKRIQVWSDGETRNLLDMYATYMPEIGPLKKFKTKKDMWAKIDTRIEGKTPKQCEERYKTVLKRKKLAVENNRTSGCERKHVDFDDELSKISFMDDSIEPEIQISSTNCIIAKKAKIKKNENPKVRNKTIQETLIEINERKEEARERRHKEKMELLKKALEINE